MENERIGPGSIPHYERCDSLRCVCYNDGYEYGYLAGKEAAVKHLLRVAEEFRRSSVIQIIGKESID